MQHGAPVSYRLTDPVNQVGLPANLKWAVGKLRAGGCDFLEAFRTKREAKAYALKRSQESK